MIVCLDTNVLIYLVEVNAIWTPKADARLKRLRVAGDDVAICDAARLECLTKPLAAGNAADVVAYRSFFADPLVRMLPVTAAVWERAALLGAMFQLKPLDSVYLAAAIEHGCGLFLTNDANLSRCTAIPVEILT